MTLAESDEGQFLFHLMKELSSRLNSGVKWIYETVYSCSVRCRNRTVGIITKSSNQTIKQGIMLLGEGSHGRYETPRRGCLRS